jgi:hypothetical protein
MIASILVIPNTKAPVSEDSNAKGFKSRLLRIDFSGSLLLGAALLLLMLPLEIGGVKVPWTHPVVFGLLGTGFITLGVFLVNEARWAQEPAFPLRLIKHRDILSSYLVISCIAAAQTTVRP